MKALRRRIFFREERNVEHALSRQALITEGGQVESRKRSECGILEEKLKLHRQRGVADEGLEKEVQKELQIAAGRGQGKFSKKNL